MTKTILLTTFKTLSIIIPLLIAVAYFTIAERKVIGTIQRRKVSNVIGFLNLLQPLADSLKLFAKEIIMLLLLVFLFLFLNFIIFKLSILYNFSLQTGAFSVSLNELSLIPEFFLAFTAVTIITHCSLIAYNKKYNNVLLQFSVTSLCMLIIFLTLLLYLHEGSITLKHLSFEFSFLSDSLGFLSKIITIIASLFCMYLLQDYIIEYKINSVEYDLLMLYAILGLTMLITANDFGTIFLALELQSLSLYLLSGFKKNSIYSIESGLKYFVIGTISTACFLLQWHILFYDLFVLIGFYFFFCIFSEVSGDKTVQSEDLLYSNKYELPETSLSSENNLFLDVDSDCDELGILLLFINNLKVVLIIAEHLCNESCDQTQSSIFSDVEVRKGLRKVPESEMPENCALNYKELTQILEGAKFFLEDLKYKLKKLGLLTQEMNEAFDSSKKCIHKIFYDGGFRPKKGENRNIEHYKVIDTLIGEKDLKNIKTMIENIKHYKEQQLIMNPKNLTECEQFDALHLLLTTFLDSQGSEEEVIVIKNFFAYNPEKPNSEGIKKCLILAKRAEMHQQPDTDLLFDIAMSSLCSVILTVTVVCLYFTFFN